ncbi:MAG: pilus assembly protein PilF [Betaproteobacteria bacterium HGW-Betaproteobacteria-7]|nr:MAG: pilus assembly protein PilF [Betaproteobacteria bacterium HGW-Betaproteobacteria-7]
MSGRALLSAVVAAFCACSVTTVYWSGLDGEFFFDDQANIHHVEELKLDSLSLAALKEAWGSGVAGPGGRPIAQISFALNYFFDGLSPFAYKVTNLGIHLVTGVLIFLVARCLRLTPVFAGLATMLWLLNPIQITSVLYVVQRMTSLSALFLLAAFLFHMKGRQCGGIRGGLSLLVAWSVFFPLSFFSKETGALFPLFVLAWELLFRRDARGELDRFGKIFAVGVGLCIALGVAYGLLAMGQWLWAGYDMRSFSLAERVLTEGRVLWLYLGLILFPRLGAYGLYHDDLALSSGLLAPWTTVPALLGLFCLIAIAWQLRRRATLLSFGILWFLIGHGLESTVLPLEIAHEHRNYLPSFGVALVLAWALMTLAQTPGWKRTLSVTLAVAMLAYSAVVTGLRAHQFGDELRRTQFEVLHHPESARAQYEAGRALVLHFEISSRNVPAYFFARTHYERAGRLSPDAKRSWLGLIQLNCKAKVPIEKVWVVELADRLHKGPLGPGDRNVLLSVKEMSIAGNLCLERQEVEELFAAALSNATVHPGVRAILHSWLADYLAVVARDISAAEAELNKSLAISPTDSATLLKLAQLRYLQGRNADASKLLERLDVATLPRLDRTTIEVLRGCLTSAQAEKCFLAK